MSYIYRSNSSASGTTATISAWVKSVDTSVDAAIFQFKSSSNTISFYTNPVLKFRVYTSGSYSTGDLVNNDRKFRDFGGWWHLVATIDTTNATSGDRLRVYINGERQTDFTTETYPSQNQSYAQLVSGNFELGKDSSTDRPTYLAHVHYCDGYAYNADSFGSTDPTTGQWKINTAPNVQYGTNGVFLKFANSGALGTDSSGNSNTMSISGTALQTKDNPSNNFPVLNRMLSATPPTTNGHTTITKTNSGYKPGLATFGAHSGKYYAEFKLETASGYTNFGVLNTFKNKNLGTGSNVDYIGDGTDGVAYQPGSSSLYYNSSSQGSYGSASQGDIIGVALDIDNGYVYWSKNGTFLNSGVPTSGGSGTGGFALSNIADTQFGNYYIFGVSVAGTSGTRTISANFGQGFFGTTAVASAGSNASGHGVFEYDVPTGYTAMCTKGLNE